MLDSRDLDISTATLRNRIALAHDRNRVLERWSELSPSALKWIASPLLGRNIADLPEERSSRINNPIVIKVIVRVTKFILHINLSHTYISTYMTYTNLYVMCINKIIDEWKHKHQLELEGSLPSPKKELVFPPVPAPCTPDYIAEHKAKKTYISVWQK
jgi:hypothetical protein